MLAIKCIVKKRAITVVVDPRTIIIKTMILFDHVKDILFLFLTLNKDLNFQTIYIYVCIYKLFVFL